jgi:RNA polymerase sigma-70 factor (ECF subfamily)
VLRRAEALAENESELLDRCRRGDAAAWRELVERHARSVFALCYRFSGRVDLAEDLTQEAFARVYQQLGRYRPADGAFGAWLATVARNLAIDQLRRTRQERLRRVDGEVMEHVASPDGNPERALQREERARLVRRGLHGLVPELRTPLVMRDLAGMSYDEIAHSMALPLGTVKSRINRARLELARRLLGLAGGVVEVE